MDALKPRLRGDATALEKFSGVMLAGLPDGCSKSSELVFETGPAKLTLSVDGKHKGAVASKTLGKALTNVYTDASAVCKLHPVAAPPPPGGAN